ncbi:HugZ family protein [Reinekea blandensis]|uniref:Pyridoxamine 5'-phosphate oxidase N-terminal domain-containing protein n=1 Tax=Reinekea blandensis MED297 TaxID=314283 RepID=A4BG03_9GAMM|nr:pyridoxamine 5'-phosphate oxidase family protein [Reinekea blandensis]EAR09021.1 hypothetical protein MED297_03992 [Reinekea sp. MED297] [Reinekea blandensis MED297]
MKNQALENRLQTEIRDHIASRRTLQLASLSEEYGPYASYAPFAFDDDGFYILISEIAIHGRNLVDHPDASVLIIEDEDTAAELFARKRVSYRVQAEHINEDDDRWQSGVNALSDRHGDRIRHLSELSDFKLFRLRSKGGRYVKGFGKAYTLAAGSLTGESLQHLRDGHKRKDTEQRAEPVRA